MARAPDDDREAMTRKVVPWIREGGRGALDLGDYNGP